MTAHNGRRTKRRYAHELYPHGDAYEPRPLTIEVPYLYARAIGFEVGGTSWFDHNTPKAAGDRTTMLIENRQIALMADAMHQGLTGDEAWEWAETRMDDAGEWVCERAVHYGVDPELIKPYPCGPEPDHHDHLEPKDARGWRTVNRVPGKESECDDCTELIPEGERK